MNSRERLLAAIRRMPTDRVPISTYELVGWNTRAFENQDASYRTVMDAIREYTDCIAMWDPTSDAQVFESAARAEMRTASERDGKMTVVHRTLATPRGELTQTTRTFDDVHTVWQPEHWCKSIDDIDAALSIAYEPLTYDFSDLERMRREVGDRGIIMSTVSDPLCIAADLMSMADYTVWALTETDHFLATVRTIHERVMENLRRMLGVAIVDLYRIIGPEYACPPFLPPDLFAEAVVPFVMEMTETIHAAGGLVRLHSHGQIARVMDLIAETNPDGIDPCEPPPDGDIDLAGVKKHLGERMCLFGNIELKLLESGTEDEVERTVIECMRAAKANGGYVIMPTAAPINSPLSKRTERNYLRYIETALQHGAY